MPSQIAKKLKNQVRQGRSMPATVIDVFSGLVTVRLSHNGAIMRKLSVVGGPVDPGQVVQVDFTTVEPTVVAVSKEWLTSDDLSKALAALIEEGINQNTVITITLFVGGAAFEMYPSTPEGMNSAIADANDGDMIMLPDVDLSGDFTIPAGVAVVGLSSRESILRGSVILEDDAQLENLCVLTGSFSSGEVIGVTVSGASAESHIRNCEIHGYNCNGGIGIGIDLESGTTIHVKNSLIIGDSSTGQAWAIRSVVGATCNVYHSLVYGKTDVYTGDGIYVFSNTEYQSEIARGCNIPVEAYGSNYRSGNFQWQIPTQFQSFDPSALAPGPITPIEVQATTTPDTGGTVLRNGNYLYMNDTSIPGAIAIKAYDMGNDTDQVQQICSTVLTSTVIHFCFVGGEKLMALEPNTANNRDIYLVDFEGGTPSSTKVYTIEKTPDITDGPGHHALVYQPAGILSVTDINGDIIVVVYGQYGEFNVDSTYEWKGWYTVAKNVTQDGGWVETFKVFENDWYATDTVSMWASPAIVRNEKIIFPLSQGSNTGSSDPTTKRLYTPVFDIATLTFTFIKRSTTDLTWGRSSNVYGCAAANDEGLCFISMNYGIETNQTAIYKIDPYEMSLDENYFQTTPLNTTLFQSRFEAYAWDASTSEKTMYILGGLGAVALFENWADFPTGFYGPHDVICAAIDDNERIWYYDDSVGTLIIGMKLTDTEDKISFDCGITRPTVSPKDTTLYCLGDRFVVVAKKVAIDDTRFYLLKP